MFFISICICLCYFTSQIKCNNKNFDLIAHSETKNYVSDRFLSVALDTIVIATKFHHFDMEDERLLQLTSYLAPAYFRIGGNLADRLYFSEKNPESVELSDITELETCFYNSDLCTKNFTNFTMTVSDWDALNKFAKNVGFTIVFDLNCLIRNDDGSWNSKNAQELIEYSNGAGYDVHWQLGNEPDAFHHMFNYSVNATQLAKDFAALKILLQKYPRYKMSLVIGPDVTRPRTDEKRSAKYLQEFLNVSKHTVDVVSFHQYYLNGHIANFNDFLKPETFDLFKSQLDLLKDIVNKAGYNNTPIWLSETSSAYGGGAPRLSDNFVSSFLWLDKLGLAAKYGLQSVIRQALWYGHYALLDDNYNPNPDWWISVIYKRLVGRQVVNCSLDGISDTVRLYCHCSNTHTAGLGLDTSAVTVFGVNINDYSATINIKGLKSEQNIAFAYIFTTNFLQSKEVFLNDQGMKINKEGRIPHYTPVFLNLHEPIIMPPYSLVFWVIPVKDICPNKPNISVNMV